MINGLLNKLTFFVLYYIIGKGRGPKCLNWCWTMNNPKQMEEELWSRLANHKDVKGAVFQKEQGENGTEHYQGYIELHTRQYTSGVIRILGEHAHCIKPNGGRMSNIRYCSKQATKIGETKWVGCIDENTATNRRGSQGQRTDLSDAVKKYREMGEGAFEILTEEGKDGVVRCRRAIIEMAKAIDLAKAKEEDRKYWKKQAELYAEGKEIEGQKQRDVYLYFGPSGCGKTTRAKMDVAGNDGYLYEKKGDTKWWCGYEGEDHVLLDEFNGDSYGNIEDFNRMTNVGVFQGETKGGQVFVKAEAVHITTNRHPCHWWKRKHKREGGESHMNWYDPRYQAVARRFKKVFWWNQDCELSELMNPNNGGDEDAWLKFWKWLKSPRSEFRFDIDIEEWQKENYFSLPPSANDAGGEPLEVGYTITL